MGTTVHGLTHRLVCMVTAVLNVSLIFFFFFFGHVAQHAEF